MDATALLRPGLLAGRTIALGGGIALDCSLAALGARTVALPVGLDEDALAAHVDGETNALVHDLRPGFGAGDQDGLSATLDAAWIAVRAVATHAFIPSARGGRIVLVAPAPDERDPAVAGVRAAAENLARTLSIEWARHGITTVAITLGPATSDAELGALVAYLASPAGDYFSGARLTLGDVAL
jgi:NAD(P)-dependent dehydrogenase (short-subunit alcohol dehydrogenase family)